HDLKHLINPILNAHTHRPSYGAISSLFSANPHTRAIETSISGHQAQLYELTRKNGQHYYMCAPRPQRNNQSGNGSTSNQQVDKCVFHFR
ncbi:hypothetical protein Trydic_g1821, partial [Trypoxylus dichotomus]